MSTGRSERRLPHEHPDPDQGVDGWQEQDGANDGGQRQLRLGPGDS
ncbi:hypothetical protein [Nonomuraea sp. NPDC049158]